MDRDDVHQFFETLAGTDDTVLHGRIQQTYIDLERLITHVSDREFPESVSRALQTFNGSCQTPLKRVFADQAMRAALVKVAGRDGEDFDDQGRQRRGVKRDFPRAIALAETWKSLRPDDPEHLRHVEHEIGVLRRRQQNWRPGQR